MFLCGKAVRSKFHFNQHLKAPLASAAATTAVSAFVVVVVAVAVAVAAVAVAVAVAVAAVVVVVVVVVVVRFLMLQGIKNEALTTSRPQSSQN